MKLRVTCNWDAIMQTTSASLSCCPHRPSSRGFLPGVRHTLSAFLIGSLLRPFLVCMTMLHRYCPSLWSPELPQMHVEHEQWAPAALSSFPICKPSISVHKSNPVILPLQEPDINFSISQIESA
jgi:hypothetical protein